MTGLGSFNDSTSKRVQLNADMWEVVLAAVSICRHQCRRHRLAHRGSLLASQVALIDRQLTPAVRQPGETSPPGGCPSPRARSAETVACSVVAASRRHGCNDLLCGAPRDFRQASACPEHPGSTEVFSTEDAPTPTSC